MVWAGTGGYGSSATVSNPVVVDGSSPQPVGTSVAVDNPVLGHHPDGSNYTRVDDIENEVSQAQLGVANNETNINGLLTSIVGLTTRVAALETAASEPVASGVSQAALTTLGTEVGTGVTYIDGREIFEVVLTQQSTGITVPHAGEVTIWSGAYEVVSMSAIFQVQYPGGFSWVKAPFKTDGGVIDIYMSDTGEIRLIDQDSEANVQQWRALVSYTKQ